jgi:VWFA-related protein
VKLPLRVSFLCAVTVVGVTAAFSQTQTQPPAATPAQTAPPAPAPIPANAPEMTTKEAPAIFKTRVDMVSVPVVVRDAKGKVIGNLTKDNFQVFDRGKPQEIVRFSVEKAGDLTAKAAKTSDVPNIEGPAMPDIPERFLAYLFDDIHLAPGDLMRARDAAVHQLAKMAKTDRAAIFTTSGQNQLEFTDDVEKLQATLLLLRNRSISGPNIGACPDVSYYMADMMINKNDPQSITLATQEVMVCQSLPANQQSSAAAQARAAAMQELGVGQQETQVSLMVIRDLIKRMGGLPGQRIMVLVSPGFITPDDYVQAKSDVLDKAIKANVTINAMDARGLWTDPSLDASQRSVSTSQFQMLKNSYDRLAASAQADVLAEMAYGTGGSFFQNNNDLDEGLRQLAGAPEYIYLLGFAPQNLKLDGTFHSIKVTVKTTPPLSMNIQARKGYYAPKKLASAEETAKEEIEESLFSRDEMKELPVELHTAFFKSSDKDANISVICKMDPKHIQFRKADGRNLNVITILSAIFDRNGNMISAIQKTVDLKMKDDTLARLLTRGEMSIKTDFSVAPGSYMVRLVVRDSEGQLMSALNGAAVIQ